MKQALLSKGRVLPVEVPAPLVSRSSILVKVVNSCISAGTELAAVQGSSKSLIRRAMDQPEKVKRILGMARSEGIAQTFQRIRGKLESSSPIGYSLAGIAVAVGEGINDIRPGDYVAAAGAGIANHAEYVDVPRNLVAPFSRELTFRDASTVTLGAIAMQSVRRAQAQLGEFIVVFGVGVLGQIALQMLGVSGARVIAVDLDDKRLALAKSLGADVCLNTRAENPINAVLHFTNGHGADAVVFSAATTDPKALSDAFAMTRKKGRVVMLGVWGQELKREDIYPKELDFLISTSYGPGRYDDNYELRGLDYPYAYVRWTENRNMEEYLRLLATGKVKVTPLIQAIYPLEQAEAAFKALQSPDDRPLMILLDYGVELSGASSSSAPLSTKIETKSAQRSRTGNIIRVGIIGAGVFAEGMHLPNLLRLKDRYEIRAVCDRSGARAQNVAKQFEVRHAITDHRELLADQEIDLVMICTRHNLHSQMVIESLRAGKHTFVEKPLCTTLEQLEEIAAYMRRGEGGSPSPSPDSSSPLLMVGFNRRFSPYAREVKKHTDKRINPLFLHYRMNAGYLPLDHWVHTEEGGGRIIGEACHILDLFAFLINSPVKAFSVASLTPSTRSVSGSDNKSIALEYEDGSVATLEYFAVGSNALSKENFEVHFDQKSIIVDDYRSMQGFGIKVADLKNPAPEKGHMEMLHALASHLRGETEVPIALHSILETTRVSIAAASQHPSD
jgi:predicted dehydrogenase/threonine dehydrogenase-like Zn-dependent dehydrogenase